jgi:hypothetical protein
MKEQLRKHPEAMKEYLLIEGQHTGIRFLMKYINGNA